MIAIGCSSCHVKWLWGKDRMRIITDATKQREREEIVRELMMVEMVEIK